MIQRKLKIVIDGNTYTVNTDEDELKVTRTAERVDERIRTIRKKAPGLTATMGAVLAALQIAHEQAHQKAEDHTGVLETLQETVRHQRVEIDGLRNHTGELKAQIAALREENARQEQQIQEASEGESPLEQLAFDGLDEADSVKRLEDLLEEANEKIFYLQRKMTDKEEELQAAKTELENFINEFENR